MDAKDIRALLAGQRDQKFRKLTQNQIDGYNKQRLLIKKSWENERANGIKRKNGNAQAVITPLGRFESKTAANRAFGNRCDFANQMKRYPHLYYYEDVGPVFLENPKHETVFYSPYGSSNSKVYLHAKAIEAGCKYAIYYTKNNKIDKTGWWSTMCKLFAGEYYKKSEPKRDYALTDRNEYINKIYDLAELHKDVDHSEMIEWFQNYRLRGSRSKPKLSIMTPRGRFNCAKEAAKAYGFTCKTSVYSKCKSTHPKYADWYAIEE